MAKPRNRVVDYTVYLAVRVMLTVLQTLPSRLAFGIADGLAFLARKIDRRHRLVALDNLRHAFPGQYTDRELDAIVAKVYRHFGRMIVEIARLGRTIRTDNWREFLSYASPEQARICLSTLLSGRPVLVVTGHFGNWELSSYMLGMFGFPVHAIARPLDNPFVDAWLRRWRERTGSKMIAKNGEFERIEEALKNGNILGTLGDQDAGARGMFVNFFNRPASTHKAVALLALQYNVPMLVMATARVGDGLKYRIYVEDTIDPNEYSHRPDAVRAITERFTQALERMIRRHPEQYFWLHRRWKHQPTQKKKAA